MPGPYDLSLVEGSIATAADVERIQDVRRDFQVPRDDRRLRHRGRHSSLAKFRRRRCVRPDRLPSPGEHHGLGNVKPHRGSRRGGFRTSRLSDRQAATHRGDQRVSNHRRPVVPTHSVCMECKMRGAVCVMVARGTPCLGPVTHDGCGALCPSYGRGCYGCFGPTETPNMASMTGGFGASAWLRREI